MRKDGMKTFWIIKGEETLPIETYTGRLGRAGQFSEIIHNNGNYVVRWASTYKHIEKQYRYSENTRIENKKNYDIILLHSKRGYQKNISLKRFRYSQDLGGEFRRLSRQEPKPDIIYCSWPLIDFAYEAVKYAKEFDIPVVIDIRDFWPDIFIQPFPKWLQPIAKLGINFLLKRKVSYVMKSADAIVGVIPKALEFAKSYGRELKSTDHVVHLAYDNTEVSKEVIDLADEFWESQGLTADKCIISFIGTLNNRLGDFDTIVEAAKLCQNSSIIFVICGVGNYFNVLKTKCIDYDNIILPGYRNGAELQSLLKKSTFGLIPLRNTDDFVDALPNKFGEYLSQGLIILSSLKGNSRQILERENCGCYYCDANSLIEGIEQIINSPTSKTIMSQNALNLFNREFNAAHVYSEFFKFIEVLANNSKHKDNLNNEK